MPLKLPNLEVKHKLRDGEGGALGDGTERDRRARYGPDTGDLTDQPVMGDCHLKSTSDKLSLVTNCR